LELADPILVLIGQKIGRRHYAVLRRFAARTW
jgi:hypothetical protein